jgi:AAA+ ATPase superfamily predicted ATPase
MPEVIIGRKEEIALLKKLNDKNSAEFLAVYGRRRVGKTHLLRNFFNAQPCVYFEATGLKDGALHQQLKLFTERVSEVFLRGVPLQLPLSWLDAFKLLTNAIEEIPHDKKIVLFFDEIPWFAKAKSGFLQALDHYWNTRWSTRPNLKLVVCGSAASWMLNNLIYAKGGLHNRLTSVIPLKPFTLHETEDYLRHLGVELNRRQILELYMVMGGIPLYLNGVQPGYSSSQIINQLCFHKDGLLFNEFSNLFASLFDTSEAHDELIRIISRSRHGLSREQILQKTKYSSSGGMFKTRLSELEEAGFIASFTPYGYLNKGTFFRVIDEYALFYLRWISPVSKRLKLSLKNTSYWESKMQSQSWKSWSGYAFESICLKHIEQIKKALGIQAIATEVGSWRYHSKNDEESGTQIDLLIDRSDGIVNLCEIKFCQGKFILTKSYAEELSRKVSVYQTHGKTNKSVFLTLITSDGVKSNTNSTHLITNELTSNDLFAK